MTMTCIPGWAVLAFRELQPTADALFDMSNIYPEHSGLPFTVWISTCGGDERLPHGPRVKIAEGRRPVFIASVSVVPTVEVVAGSLSASQLHAVTQWIRLNRETLLQHWEGEIDSVTALQQIKALP